MKNLILIAILNKIVKNKQDHRKVPLSNFYLNGHRYLRTRKLEPVPCTSTAYS